MVRQEIISYYEGVIVTDENSYKRLMKIKNDVERLKDVRDMKVYSEVIDITSRKMHELNKRKYLKFIREDILEENLKIFI